MTQFCVEMTSCRLQSWSLQESVEVRFSSPFELMLADGSRLTGSATIELPQHHSRLLDYLNASAEPFFAITTADEIHLVNRAHVLYARPED